MFFLSLSGAVLAGGKGERMASQDKGLLLFSWRSDGFVCWFSFAASN